MLQGDWMRIVSMRHFCDDSAVRTGTALELGLVRGPYDRVAVGHLACATAAPRPARCFHSAAEMPVADLSLNPPIRSGHGNASA